MTATARLDLAIFDAADIEKVGSFYAELTGWDVVRNDSDRFGVRAPDGQEVEFQRAPDHVAPRWPGQEYPQQFHLDLQTDDPQAEAERAVGLGATRLADGPTWITLADPAGHPFDLCQADGVGPLMSLFAVTIDAPDASALAHFYGTYAEYAVASADYVVPVPDGVSSLYAAPLTCAGVTTYKAVKVSGARSSDLVAVFGIGGLGHLALQYARIAGAIVVAVDVEDDKLELARELGADHVVNARTGDPVGAIQALGGADAAIALAVSPQSMRQAFDSLKRGGRLVLVALPRDNELALPIFQTVLRGISVIGSIVGTRLDLAEVFELHAAGRTKVIAQGRQLDDVNACFDEVLSGKVPARLVFEF